MKIRTITSAILLAISGITFTAIADETSTVDANEYDTTESENTGFKQYSWGDWRDTFGLNSPNTVSSLADEETNDFSSLADKVINDDNLSDTEKWIRLFNLSKQQYAYAECRTGHDCGTTHIEYESLGGQHPGEGEGMGLLAHELGYKPGSKDFKDLKLVIQDGDSDALHRLGAGPYPYPKDEPQEGQNEETKSFKVAKKEKAAPQAKLTEKKKVARNNQKGAKEKGKKDKKNKNKS